MPRGDAALATAGLPVDEMAAAEAELELELEVLGVTLADDDVLLKVLLTVGTVAGGAAGVVAFPPSGLAAKLGAGTALDGSARAPIPHGIGSFEVGWVGLAGGVLCPDAEAIVKRVVHVLSGDSGEENWKK